MIIANADHESVREICREKEFRLKAVLRFSKLSGLNEVRLEIAELMISSLEL